MKVSAAVSLCLAPLVLAKSANSARPQRRGQHSKDNAGELLSSISESSVVGNPQEIAGLGFSGFGIQQDAIEEVIILWFNNGGGGQTTVVNTVTRTVIEGAAATNQGTGVSDSGVSATAAATGAAVTHAVTVGGPAAGLAYSPDSIEAAVGDTVIFTFLSENHTATQSAFDTPCVALAGGMDSSFQPNPNNTVNPPPQVAMQVMVATPLWFYCRQTGHCGKGMTFSINPTATKTQALFQAMAIAQNGTGTGTGITGGAAGSSSSSSVVVSPGTSLPATATLGSGADAAATSAAASTNGVTTGTGVVNSDGSCSCAVVCAAVSFPNVAQGAGAFGGFGGAIPAAVIAT